MAADRIENTVPFSGFSLLLGEAAALCDAQARGDDVLLQGVSTDTRNIEAGNLFVALHGDHFDGHDFLAQAFAKGAAAAMIDQDCASVAPVLCVSNTREALGRLATGWRRRFKLPVAAVTGSNGKTTVRSMITAICSQQHRVLATIGNLNNDIGLPLTLLRLSADDQMAVLELGANHAGEIAYLTELAAPDVAVVTNASAAHLEGFGTLEGVARAKGELFSGLAADGIAVINADDRFATLWHTLAGPRRVITFGLQNPADVSAQCQMHDGRTEMVLDYQQQRIPLHLPVPGRHNVMNALAASAVAIALELPISVIKAGLESMQAVPGRLQIHTGLHGSRVIDDTYNANPASLAAALDVLAGFPGRHVLVLGDMAELGPNAEALHEESGRLAHHKAVDALFALGPLSAAAVRGFTGSAQHFEDHAALIAALREQLGPEVTVLIKGSRRMQMDRVVRALLDEEGSP